MENYYVQETIGGGNNIENNVLSRRFFICLNI